VKELVDNEWLFLYQLDATERAIYARRNGAWVPSSSTAIDPPTRPTPRPITQPSR
jgi:hypothetical protein